MVRKPFFPLFSHFFLSSQLFCPFFYILLRYIYKKLKISEFLNFFRPKWNWTFIFVQIQKNFDSFSFSNKFYFFYKKKNETFYRLKPKIPLFWGLFCLSPRNTESLHDLMRAFILGISLFKSPKYWILT